MEGVREDSPSIRWRSCPVLVAPDRTRLGLFRQAAEGGGRRRLLARLHFRRPLQPLVASPTCSRLSHQALAHESVDLLAEEVALLPSHARNQSSPTARGAWANVFQRRNSSGLMASTSASVFSLTQKVLALTPGSEASCSLRNLRSRSAAPVAIDLLTSQASVSRPHVARQDTIGSISGVGGGRFRTPSSGIPTPAVTSYESERPHLGEPAVVVWPVTEAPPRVLTCPARACHSPRALLTHDKGRDQAMERTGIEPVTSGLQSRRSPS